MTRTSLYVAAASCAILPMIACGGEGSQVDDVDLGPCGASDPFERSCGSRGVAEVCLGRTTFDFDASPGPITFSPEAPGAYALGVSFDEYYGFSKWTLTQGGAEVASGTSTDSWESATSPLGLGATYDLTLDPGGAGSPITSATLTLAQVSYGTKDEPWPLQTRAEHCHSVGLYGQSPYRGSSQSIYVFEAPETGTYEAVVSDFRSTAPMELELRPVGADGDVAGAFVGAAEARAMTQDNAASLTHDMNKGDQVVYVISNKAREVGGKSNAGADAYTFKVALE